MIESSEIVGVKIIVIRFDYSFHKESACFDFLVSSDNLRAFFVPCATRMCLVRITLAQNKATVTPRIVQR